MNTTELGLRAAESALKGDVSTVPLWTAIALTAAVSLGAIIYFYIYVERLRKMMDAPSLKEFTFATALYPDALIVKFGVEQKYRTLSSRIKFANVPWARMQWHLEKSLVDVIYANRRSAGEAIAHNPHIIASERPLCIYRGFAVCLKPSAADSMQIQSGAVNELAAILKSTPNARILVHDNTDQYRALRKLLLKIFGQNGEMTVEQRAKRADDHIERISPDSDLLELMWEVEVPSGGNAPAGADEYKRNVIGFAGGLTERVIAKRAGYHIIAPDGDDPDFSEINSFVYCSPPDGCDGDLPRMLQEVQQLWEDTVTRILSQPQTEAHFGEFLNANIRTQLGPTTLARLRDQPVFSDQDVKDFLSEWVQFPRHGKPIIVGIAPARAPS